LPPIAYRWYPPDGSFAWHSHPPLFDLLPWLDKNAIVSAYPGAVFLEVSDYEPFPLAPDHPGAVRIRDFLCPSDVDGTGTNVRFCAGSHPSRLEPIATSQAGVFAIRNSATTMAAVVDGASHTAAMSEKLRGGGNRGRFSPQTDTWYSGLFGLLGRIPTTDEMFATCTGLSEPPSVFYVFNGWAWCAFQGYRHSLYNHISPPNSRHPDCSANNAVDFGDGVTTYDREGSYRANSRHPGTVNVLLLDGAVRSVSDNVDLKLWRGLSTINGGDAALTD
jgi:prepilin-type processing-associated H-X9-DG protein